MQTQTGAPIRSRNHDTSIRDVRFWTVREPASHRTWSIFAARSADGLTGYGEGEGLVSREAAARAPALIGRDVTSYAGVSLHDAIDGAINAALLDLAAKSAKAPLYRFLGGPTRFKARVMRALSGEKDEDLIADMQRGVEEGYRAFGAPLPPSPARNQGKAFANAAARRLEALRKAGGDDVDFVLMGEGALTPGDASSLAAEVERFHLLWFDEPCPATNLDTLRKISDESVTPLGFGKGVANMSLFQDLLRDGLAAVIRPEIHAFGITNARRIAALAETYYTAVAPRGSLGPVGNAASIQYAASIPNFFIAERPRLDERDRDLRRSIVAGGDGLKDGYAALPTGPGIGVDVDEAALDRLAFERSSR